MLSTRSKRNWSQTLHIWAVGISSTGGWPIGQSILHWHFNGDTVAGIIMSVIGYGVFCVSQRMKTKPVYYGAGSDGLRILREACENGYHSFSCCICGRPPNTSMQAWENDRIERKEKEKL